LELQIKARIYKDFTYPGEVEKSHQVKMYNAERTTASSRP